MKAAELIEDLFSDAMRARHARAEDEKKVRLVHVNKDGTDSKMVMGTRRFRTKAEAIEAHNISVKLNTNRTVVNRLYVETGFGTFKMTLTGHHEEKK